MKDYCPYTLNMQTQQFSRYFKGRNLQALSFVCQEKKNKKREIFHKNFCAWWFMEEIFRKDFSKWAKSKKKILI